MFTTIKAIGIELTETQRKHLEKKAAKLDRYFGDDVECLIRIREDHHRKIVELTLPLRGATLRAQEGTDDLYASMDAVMEKIMRQIRKQRTRLEKRTREGAYAKAEMEDSLTVGAVETEETGRLVRTKNFGVEPMTAEEAISQMEMLGHSFFVFLNEQTDTICVVYAREDGNFGLLIPER